LPVFLIKQQVIKKCRESIAPCIIPHLRIRMISFAPLEKSYKYTLLRKFGNSKIDLYILKKRKISTLAVNRKSNS
jgi:aromatic ring-opening dioxygenase LigB subunit